MAFLKMIKGSCPGQILELRGERSIVGRHPSCEIVLESAAVSRHHAQILESHGNYFLEDLRSRNRTFLNAVPIEGRTELREADVVRICDVSFSFHRKLDGPAEPDGGWRETEAATVRPAAAFSQSATYEFAEPPVSEELLDEESSVISTLDARSAPNLRLDVRPETKLRAVLGISRALANVLRPDDVLQAILDGLFQIFGQADEGFILLRSEYQGAGKGPAGLVIRASKSRSTSGETAARPSMTIARQAVEKAEAILSANALQDPRFDMSESLSNLRIRSIMCVPLLGKDSDPLGVIQIVSKDLRQHFSQDDLDLLTSVATQASLAVDNAHLHEELLQQREMQKEMEFAAQVQLGFLPSQPPHFPDYEFGDYYEAALRVGGDYFDYVELADGRVAIALGDVAGKGVPAALLMARLYSAARYHLLTKPTASRALGELNAEIASSGLGHRFITCVFAILDRTSHTISIANAGHFPPLHRDVEGRVTPIGQKLSGLPLGVAPHQQFEDVELQLQPGEDLTLYTDGITEAMNMAGDIYGRRRLTDYVSHGPAGPAELVAGIVADVDLFSEGRPQRDDMCLVSVRRIPTKPAPRRRAKPV